MLQKEPNNTESRTTRRLQNLYCGDIKTYKRCTLKAAVYNNTPKTNDESKYYITSSAFHNTNWKLSWNLHTKGTCQLVEHNRPFMKVLIINDLYQHVETTQKFQKIWSHKLQTACNTKAIQVFTCDEVLHFLFSVLSVIALLLLTNQWDIKNMLYIIDCSITRDTSILIILDI